MKLSEMSGVFLQNLKQEVLKVKTIELVNRASRVLEKLLWIAIAISGTVWFLSFMSFQFKIWNENLTFRTESNVVLSDIDRPAVTFCSKTANKYGIVERLGNHINPKAKLNQEFFAWLEKIIVNDTIDNFEFYMQQKEGPGDVFLCHCLIHSFKKLTYVPF